MASVKGVSQQGLVILSDEMFAKINGEHVYLWCAVDQDGDVLDILVQRPRNRVAAERFFRKLLERQGRVPRVVVTDRLKSYHSAATNVLSGAEHAQRFLSLQARVNNLFRYGRHLDQAKNHRMLRERAFSTSSEVTCANAGAQVWRHLSKHE